jgi:hypothetical protein
MKAFDKKLFAEKLIDGDEGERCFKHWANETDEVLSVSKAPHQSHPYDFLVEFQGVGVCTFEVKTACPRYDGKPWEAFTAEVCSIYGGKEHLPQYRKFTDEVDYIVYFDKDACELYFYEASAFAGYVERNVGSARMNKYGTASYVFVPKMSVAAGFRRCYKWDSVWSLQECV